MNICDFPQNVLQNISNHLEVPFKVRFAITNKHIFESIIGTVYSIVVYHPVGYEKKYDDDSDNHNHNIDIGLARRNDHVLDNTITLLSNKNIVKFFETISQSSFLNFNYSDFVTELYLEKLDDLSVFNILQWRNSINLPIFQNLKQYQFPTNIEIQPLTFENAPNLDTLIIDHNFCNYLDYNKGSIGFFNNAKIVNLFFKGTLGKNEDMVIFKLITSFPQMIKRLHQLHFLVDTHENYDFVYRRIVGFFAILRKMNLIMHNISKLSLTLTNVSSSTVLLLISKHIIFENLIDLSLFIQDDSKILTLVKSLDKLSTIVHHHGFNIKKLLLKYNLIKEDTEKNHLRSMMLLKLCESFNSLTHLNIDLTIDGLDLSNLLMILGTPISNNVDSLYDIRINVFQPSENLIGNILPTLEDTILLFPHLNFLNNCGCPICNSILETLSLNDNSNLNLFDETIKVSTLLIIGQELDLVQNDCTYSVNSNSIINQYSRFLRLNNYSKNGYLFDHLIGKQLNHSLAYLPNLEIFEICGLVYTKSNKITTMDFTYDGDVVLYDQNDDDEDMEDDDGNDNDEIELRNNHYLSNDRSFTTSKFELLYGNEFTGLDSHIITNITDLGRVFNGNL